MENKKTFNFFFLIGALILGKILFKHFDFENLKFEKPALDILYLIVLGFSIYLLVRDNKKSTKE